MVAKNSDQSTLSGQLLVAMPQMSDPRFARSVVYLCAHSSDGAMGLVVNRLIDSLTFGSLLSQLGVEAEGEPTDMPVHFGGPVESSRGFVLHTSDYLQDSTLVIDDEIALTATVDVLKAIARGDGPRCRVLALGYAGWAPGTKVSPT
jgi:putative transcriptional regulator